MSKLTKAQAKAHAEAEKTLGKDRLSDDDRLFVIENWQESAKHINSIAGAFFTPWGLARDFAIEVGPGRVIDLCAGIGTLSLACLWGNAWNGATDLVCIEANPDYVEIGRKIVPEARWIVGDVLDLPADLGRFDTAIGNPPFGGIKRTRNAPRYAGKAFELHVIDIASDLADHGVFIVPQMTAGFAFSGTQRFEARSSDTHDKLKARTGIILEPNCGIDTDLYRDLWHGVAVTTEIVTIDFVEARERRAPKPAEAEPAPVAEPRAASPVQADLFARAA